MATNIGTSYFHDRKFNVIQSEQQFAKYREAQFRLTSNHVNSAVFWWGLLQVVIVIAVNVLSMVHMRSFFLSKKLV